jgi:hypothetical protein
VLATVPTFATALLKFAFSTSKTTVLNEEIWSTIDEQGAHCLAALWHENIAPTVYLLRNRGFTGLVSQSFDGELAARMLKKFDVRSVRGSSSRGGLKAMGELLNEVNETQLVGLTIDGPKGPRRKAKPGLAMLSAQSNLPILPIASVISPSRRLNSWDRMPLPLPFSKFVLKFGALLEPTESLRKASVLEKTLELETKMNALQEELESDYQIDARLDEST